MCRWGCEGLTSTFMCKWCGTRYCRECLHGEFRGLMRAETVCAKCNQKNCQGKRVENVLKEYLKDDDGKGGRGGKSGSSSARGRSSSPSKKGKKSGKKAGKSGGGSKKGKKKKKKK